MAECCRSRELGLFGVDARRPDPGDRAVAAPRMGHSSASGVHPRAAKCERSIRQARDLPPDEEGCAAINIDEASNGSGVSTKLIESHESINLIRPAERMGSGD